MALKPAPWGVVPNGEWTDQEDRLAAEWLQKQGILVLVAIAGQAVHIGAAVRQTIADARTDVTPRYPVIPTMER